MLKITITEVPPYDGEYELTSDRPFNGNELHLIKRFAGVRLAEIDEGLEAGDYDLLLALTTIALWRDGKADKRTAALVAEVLRDADAGKIKFEPVADDSAEVEADAGPPESDASESSEPASVTLNGHSEQAPETILSSSGSRG